MDAQGKRNIVIVGTLTKVPLTLSEFMHNNNSSTPTGRRRHHRMHNGLLPDTPSQVQSGPAHRHPPRSDLDCRRRIWQVRRAAGTMGIPNLHRTVIIPSTQRARSRTQWRRALGLPPSGMRQSSRDSHDERHQGEGIETTITAS